MGLEISHGDFRCIPAVVARGTSSIAILYLSLIIEFIASDTLLSRMCFFGTIPACSNHVINTQYALASSWSFLLPMGSTKIALLSISTMTIMYLLPCWDRVGKRPVWSEITVSCMSYTHVNTSHTFLPVSCDVLGSSRGDCVGCSHVVGLAFVDHKFFRV